MKACSLKLYVCCLFGVFLIGVDAYVYLNPQKEGAANCVDESGNEHKMWSTWYNDEKCERLTCIESARSLFISGTGCGHIIVPSDCEIIKGTGSYPDCCSSPNCYNR